MILRILAVVAGLGAILAIVAVLAVQYVSGPLRQASPRVCSSCFEMHWNGRSTVRAGNVSASYRFTDDVSYLVRFDGGDVALGRRSLAPGCHVGRASEGATIELRDADTLRLEAPAPDGGCAALEAESDTA